MAFFDVLRGLVGLFFYYNYMIFNDFIELALFLLCEV